MKKALSISPYFHQGPGSPFDAIEWDRTEISIAGDGGKSTVFKQPDVEFPKQWSPLALKIAASKYFYGDIANGVDPSKGGRESSIRQLVSRVVDTITEWGKRDGYFASDEDAENFRNELTFLCVNQYGAFNSPVWFNVGLYDKYGIGKDSAQGNWIFDRTTGKSRRAATQYEAPQCSACFIQSVDDNMESILDLARSEAMLFKFGSGTGSDLSTLRSSREKLAGGGTPSGPLSFLRVYDQIAGTVKSGGKTRRAAKMNTLRTSHPDIEEFINAKQNEEKKAWALIEQGYDGSFNGEAYGSVMYQNENLSVRASDGFMEAAVAGDPWWTHSVTTGLAVEKKNAGEMLRKIAEGTHICGDPGMQFDDTIHKMHTCKGTARQNSTNPCSEYLFLDDTACNLASLNLMKFKRADGSFNVEAFKTACRIYIIAQDILVDNSSYPTERIAINSHIFRTLGLGFANLGSLLMSYGYGYDSDEGRSLAGAITALMTGEAYRASAEMAAATEPFAGYHNAATPSVPKPLAKDNVEAMLGVIELHRASVAKIAPAERSNELIAAAQESWDSALALGREHGYRNAQVTVLAPTGTIGFLMDCDTTGIEPAIALVAHKTLAGGGYLKLVNQTVPLGLKALGYSDNEIVDINKFITENDTIEGAPHLKAEHVSVFDCAFKGGEGTRSLTYMGHLKMMAACQPFLSGAISKTVNLPQEATIEDIENTYVEAWKMGLKAVAIYRDGSKRSAPLTTTKARGATPAPSLEEAISEGEELLKAEVLKLRELVGRPSRRHMPETRPSLTHKFSVGGHEGYITVGLFEDGTPGEVFISMSKEGSTIGGLMDVIGTLLSMALQYGVPLESLVKKFSFTNFEPSGFTPNKSIPRASSLIDYVVKWMHGQFGHLPAARESFDASSIIAPRVQVAAPAPAPVVAAAAVEHAHAEAKASYDGNVCHTCGSSDIVKTGTCGACRNCGSSQGCS